MLTGSPWRTRVRNRVARIRQRRWRLAAHTSSADHIVMGGAPRSGTTLLRRMLDRHPAIVSGPETKLFVPAAFNLEWLARAYDIPLDELRRMRAESTSQAAFIDAFAARVLRASGKTRWAEKTPMNIRSLDWILERFPQASVIHIIRDGRDVVCSMRGHPDWRWQGGGWQKVLVPRPLEVHARRWVADTAMGMDRRAHPAYVEIRYEDLVTDPERTLREVCRGVGADPDPAWLAAVTRPEDPARPSERPDDKGGVSRASIGRWRDDLTADEQRRVMDICGPRLRELGYLEG